MMVSGAGSAPARNRIARSLADCTVKLPEICPAPPVIGSRITGADSTLLSRMIAKGWPTFSSVAVANLREPDVLNLNETTGSPVRGSKRRLRIGQVGALHQCLLLHDIRRLRLLRRIEYLVLRRQLALRRLIGRNRDINHAELELRGFAENALQPCRILQSGHLYQNAIKSLPLDQRLDGAQRVDALLDDLDRLVDRLADAFSNDGLRHRQTDQSAAGISHFDTARCCRAKHTADRLRQLAQLAQRRLRVVRIGETHLDRVAANHDATGEADARITQRTPGIVHDLVELVLLDRVGIDLEQDVRTALQVEAEHHPPLRPLRPGLHIGFGEEVRHRAQTDHDRGQNDCKRSQWGEVKHQFNPLRRWLRQHVRQLAAASSLAGSPLVRTPEIMLRIWRTRTPSAISTSI